MFGALRLEGCRFESHFGRHAETLGKSFTRSCLQRFGVLTPTQYQCCNPERFCIVVGLKRRYRNIRNECMNSVRGCLLTDEEAEFSYNRYLFSLNEQPSHKLTTNMKFLPVHSTSRQASFATDQQQPNAVADPRGPIRPIHFVQRLLPPAPSDEKINDVRCQTKFKCFI